MPFKLDIFNKEVLANQSDYRTVNLLLSGEVEQPDLSPYATKSSLSGYAPLSSLNALNNYLPLSGGTLTGNLNFTAGRQIRLVSPDNVGVPLEAANIFGSEYGLKTSQLQLTGGRFDLDGDPTLNRAEFRVSGASTQFNIYNKNLARYYLRINPTGGFMEGLNTNASGDNSHAEGNNTTASGESSHAAGAYSRALYDRSWIWRGTTGSNTQVSTTRADQFMVSAEGGIALYNQVGIGTDNIQNALTVVGDISATGNIYGVAVNALNNFIYTVSSIPVLANKRYGFDTTSGPLTATLPPNPQLGDEIEFFDACGRWFVNPLTIDNNTKYIEQQNDKLLCNVKFGLIKLIYTGNIVGWRIIPYAKHDVPSFIEPIISISSTIDFGYDPITVGFIGISNLTPAIAPVDNWFWNLTSGGQPDYFTRAVTYTYNTPGVYTVTLTGVNFVGIGTATKTITALPVLVPVPTITTSALSSLIPFTLSLNSNNTLPVSSSPVINWYWNLTGGNDTQFTTQNVTFTYDTSGVYVVSLSAENASGIGTATIVVTAVQPLLPTPAITSSALSSIIPFTLSLNGNNTLPSNVSPVNAWAWNLTSGNDAQFTTQNITSYTYNTSGVYTINLSAFNITGAGTTSITVTAVQPLVPVPVISASAFTGSTPLTVTLTGFNTLPLDLSPVDNWYWNLTGGDNTQFTTQVTTFTYTSAGVYTVNLTASNITGFGTTTTTITATTPVVPPLTGADPFSDYVTLLLHFNT